jgi:6-methylsalicylate decarboxylase
MWYHTVGHGHVPALRCAIDSFGADRLLLSTDFPGEAGNVFVRAVQYIADPQIAEDNANANAERNATALFGMTTPPPRHARAVIQRRCILTPALA